MIWPSISIGDLVQIRGGGTPRRDNEAFFQGDIPWVTPKDMKSWKVGSSQIRITREAVEQSAARMIDVDSVLIVVRSGILKHSLPVAINTVPVAINQDMKALSCRPGLDPGYLARQIKAGEDTILSWVRATTADNFPIDKLKEFAIPLPPLPEQRRIAAVLDQADALRAKRRAALARLDEMGRAIFVEMFGDPLVNGKDWPLVRLGDLAIKFSDGPFGSNLKSSHYAESGVRVVRLQNIGTGEFLGRDAAFITERHFQSLAKHECIPGDVLVGTLGEPNLRACIQPVWLKRALNKADCVQVRVDPKRATAEYVEALLNHPSTECMAQDRIVGQTRLRISMGRLREMCVPMPPVPQQQYFAMKIAQLKQIKVKALLASHELTTLFASLQHRAFRGEL